MIAPTVERSFYFVGGSMPRNAASYVRRRADEELLSALLNGEYCYVLTSRQMGKSSLMIHTVMHLQERGVHTGVIDLTSLRQNLTVEQWYRGMLNRRDSEPELSRLTFCLLGVASPSDLIRHGHITPFNIARRIELHDFTTKEADRANSYLYVADMNLAQQAWEATPVQVEHVKALLAETRTNKYRGFVWGYWNRLCHLSGHA